jgi:hypothetical protein
VSFKLGGWAWTYKQLALKNMIVRKLQKGPMNWKDSLDKRHNVRKIDIIFSTWSVRSLYTVGSLKTAGKEIL